MKRPVCALVSGGLDSMVLLDELAKRYRPVVPVYIRQGLAWERDEVRHLHNVTILELPVRDLYNIAQHGPVLFESALDLIESVFALRSEIALMQNVAALPVFVFGPTPARKIIFPGPVTVTASENRPLVHSL